MTSTPDPQPVLRSLAPYLADWAAFHADHRGITGLQLAVARRGELLLDLAHGQANAETGEPLRTDHRFIIASHSKTMTATLVMQLVEEGALRLDDTVAERYPDLAGSAVAGTTLRELLGHQGGFIRDSSDGDFWQYGRDFFSADDLVAMLRREGQVFEPNTHFKYSNMSFSLLGLILERVTGRSYQELAHERIVQPLGLEQTGPGWSPELDEHFAAGHSARFAHGDSRRALRHVDTATMLYAGGWYSTAADMTRYGAAHCYGDDRLLTDASKRLMQREESRPHVRGEDLGAYGLGMQVRTVGKRRLVGHSGGYPGHITRTWIDPVDGLVVSALTNDVDGPAAEIAVAIIRLIDLALDAAASEPEPLPQELRDVLGRWAGLWGVTDIVDLGGVLHLINPGDPAPSAAANRLDVTDGGGAPGLRVESVDGYGDVGERIGIGRDDDGAVRTLRFGGTTAWPYERYREAMAAGNPTTIPSALGQ
ncbi:serine hydrolase domain-containing protein [Bogoriella caseilytica]|uniref:CubicO group peptidase (Beta-lactamase class C family) n=1 Tax=Bogoriella caseilytica TaxID=56055 RepID=A0A3N2BBW1_9MICO|nr:serine hydrolase domain-containing protein [Bogoriella caseilytica]ROR72725.1 CubicO group peptidase (beta-lactamase class C family) [Bogoriella caseilytica]